jgi:hypothetical protein
MEAAKTRCANSLRKRNEFSYLTKNENLCRQVSNCFAAGVWLHKKRPLHTLRAFTISLRQVNLDRRKKTAQQAARMLFGKNNKDSLQRECA